MDKAILVQFAGSAAAVVALVGLAAWARIAKPAPPLDESQARALLADEFPGRRIEGVWVALDGKGAVARSGALALVLCQVGDGYAARQIPWAKAVCASFRNGELILDLADIAAPRAVLLLPSWPPQDLAA